MLKHDDDTIRARALVFRITTADGRTVTGPVQGTGGLVGAAFADGPRAAAAPMLARLRGDVRRAAKGLRLSCYEPKPGHVRVKPDYCAESDGTPIDVSLVGARIEVVL